MLAPKSRFADKYPQKLLMVIKKMSVERKVITREILYIVWVRCIWSLNINGSRNLMNGAAA